MTVLQAIADPANWRTFPIWFEGHKFEVQQWIGDPHIQEQAKLELIESEEANNE
jgi:hypothetical protein